MSRATQRSTSRRPFSSRSRVQLHPKWGVAFFSMATEILYEGAAGGGEWHRMRAAVYCRRDAPDPPLCPDCREPMKLVKTIPHVGGLPEIFVFYCSRCKQAETKEQVVCRRPIGVVVGNERKAPTFWEV
jgi:hypothetical protein